jgi:two-component system response regulator YesN
MGKVQVEMMLKILIAEDEDIIRKGLVFTIDWLSMDCVIVAEASDGEEGLQKIIEFKPDVVITDIKMPKMDGIEMVRQGLKQVKFKSIILTSYTEFEYAKKAIELKAYEYLVKPIDEEKIIEVIQGLHDQLDRNKEAEFVLETIKNPSAKIDFNHYIQLDTTENGFVAKAIQKIQDNYMDKIGIETISEELGVSASYLSRKFKEVTNHSFLDLLNQYRVQQAIKLLNTGRYRVYEISDMTGFGDYKHFCTVFKRYTAMSPTGFVKKRT